MEEPQEQDHYSVLGVRFNATRGEIRSAARKLHLQYHPDKGGNSEQFCKVRLAEEILTDGRKRCEFDKRYPSVHRAWQSYRSEEELRRQWDEEFARVRREEANRRTQESIRRAQEEQQRAAQERLRKWHEEEKRKRKLEADRRRAQEEEEERRKKLEADRRKAEEEEQRLRAERLRRSRLEQEAKARSEAVMERRRIEVQEQANRRMKQQFADDQLQEQRKTWSQFYQRGQTISSPSMPTQQSTAPERICKHNLWVKRKGTGTCDACARVNHKMLMKCPDCLQVRCQTCAT